MGWVPILAPNDDDDNDLVLLLLSAPVLETTTPLRATAHGVDTYPGPRQ